MESLSSDEILSVLRVAHKESKRDHLMILFAFRFGLRATEVCQIKLDDIQNGALTVQRLKGSKKTVTPLPAHRGIPLLNVVQSLKQWLQVRPKDSGNVLFPSAKGGPMLRQHFYTIFRKYCLLAGVPESKAHPHIAKHSLCTLLCRNGVDVAQIQTLVGHADVSSTMIYISLNESEVAAKAQNALMSVF